MRSWLGLDNWFIRVSVTEHDHEWRMRRQIERKAEELEADRHLLTNKGRCERQAFWSRYCAARDDEGFRAFLSRIPALAPKPRRQRKVVSHG